MPKSTTLEKLRDDGEICDILASALDFNLGTTASDGGWFEVRPVADMKIIARDATGGIFLLYGPRERLIHVTSEGQAGVIAQNLEDGLRIMIAYPYWRDLLKFSGGGKLDEMRRVAQYLERNMHEDYPEIDRQRSIIEDRLSLERTGDMISSLHAAVATLGSGILVTAPDGTEFQSLFNTFTVESNPSWRNG
jgi:hypothetical protein